MLLRWLPLWLSIIHGLSLLLFSLTIFILLYRERLLPVFILSSLIFIRFLLIPLWISCCLRSLIKEIIIFDWLRLTWRLPLLILISILIMLICVRHSPSIFKLGRMVRILCYRFTICFSWSLEIKILIKIILRLNMLRNWRFLLIHNSKFILVIFRLWRSGWWIKKVIMNSLRLRNIFKPSFLWKMACIFWWPKLLILLFWFILSCW